MELPEGSSPGRAVELPEGSSTVALPEGSSTVALLAGGVDAVGKKLVEEAAEVWMAARFESDDALALECSQVLYYVACMMAARGIPLAAVEEKL